MTQQQHTPSNISNLRGDEDKPRSHHALSPLEEMNRFFESVSPRHWMRPMQWDWPEWGHLPSPFGGKMPRVDMIDRDGELLIRAELPGVEKDDLDVSMTDNTITIKGKTASEDIDEKENYYRAEITRGAFSRTLVLPADVDLDKIHSTFKNGLLEMTVPKQDKTRRKVKID